MSADQCLALKTKVVNHNMSFQASGGVLAPKHHMWFHLAEQFELNGNMKCLSTYPDETLNGSFAKVMRSTHAGHAPLMCIKKYKVWCDVNGLPL